MLFFRVSGYFALPEKDSMEHNRDFSFKKSRLFFYPFCRSLHVQAKGKFSAAEKYDFAVRQKQNDKSLILRSVKINKPDFCYNK